MGTESAGAITEQAPKQEKQPPLEELIELFSKIPLIEMRNLTPLDSKLTSAKVAISKLKEGISNINTMDIEPAIRILNTFPKIVVLTKPIRGMRLRTPLPVTPERDSKAIIAESCKEIIKDGQEKIRFTGFYAELPSFDELCDLRGEEFGNYTVYLQTDKSEEVIKRTIKKALNGSSEKDFQNWTIDPREFRFHQEFPLRVPQPAKASA